MASETAVVALDEMTESEPDFTAAEPARAVATDHVPPASIVEAILLSTDDPLSAGAIAEIAGLRDANAVKSLVSELNERYEAQGASYRIEAIAKGFQILTLPAYNAYIQKLNKARADSRLSPAALETLAIVAYKQPVLRADIEAVRGVAVGDMLIRLRDTNLIRIVGRAEEIGRPLLYGTTTKFLEVFGLASLKDLPKIDEDQPGTIPPLKLANPRPEADPPAENA